MSSKKYTKIIDEDFNLFGSDPRCLPCSFGRIALGDFARPDTPLLAAGSCFNFVFLLQSIALRGHKDRTVAY